MRGGVIFFGTNDAAYRPLGELYAKTYGLGYECVPRGTSMFAAANKIKVARFVVIWNGMQNEGPLAAALCERRGIPHCFVEQGFLKQSETYSVDLTGFCGRSFLNRPLSWVTDEDRERLHATRRALREAHPTTDEGFVLVPLQVENDSQVLYYSPYPFMQDAIGAIERMYPGVPIVFRPHPKRSPSATPLVSARSRVERGGDYLDWARRASIVVGLNSTALLEALILGKPVHALADCPLRFHHHDKHDDLAAAALAMRIDRKRPDLAGVLERFNIRPLGCDGPKEAACHGTARTSRNSACLTPVTQSA